MVSVVHVLNIFVSVMHSFSYCLCLYVDHFIECLIMCVEWSVCCFNIFEHKHSLTILSVSFLLRGDGQPSILLQ